MKIVTILICSIGIIGASFGVDNTVTKQKRRKPPRHHLTSRPSGGLVEKAYSGNVFRVYNAQNSIPENDIVRMTREMRINTHLPIECTIAKIKGEVTLSNIISLVKSSEGVGASAILVNSDKLPVIMFSPDQRWGILNITPLMVDNPSKEKFCQRFSKAYWNVVARTLGAGTSSFPGCVIMPFSNQKELDAITAVRPCPESFNKMVDTASKYGIDMLKINTYRRACEEGWASDPTNDIQKAIWNEVHAAPKTPMKIEFDPKKGR